jgi:hypothetical protein
MCDAFMLTVQKSASQSLARELFAANKNKKYFKKYLKFIQLLGLQRVGNKVIMRP